MLEVLRSGRLSLGPAIDRFEELFAEQVGAPYAAAVSSGTAGCTCCAVIAGVGEGDEVITSPYSFVASANCFIYEGATPVFADVDERTMNLDPAAVEAAITERTRAIVAVDIFGYPCELDPLRELCERHGLVLVQDACEALGARVQGRAGRLARRRRGLRLLSEQADDDRRGRDGHHALRGGAAAARQPAQPGPRRRRRLARARAARLQLPDRRHPRRARDRAAREARHDPGASRRRRRRATASCWPMSRASSCRSRTTRITSARGSSTSSRSTRGVDREGVIAELERQGIATSRYLPSIHLQSYMRERYGFREGLCPVSEDLSQPHPGAAVLHRDRGRGPGTRRAGPARGARVSADERARAAESGAARRGLVLIQHKHSRACELTEL